MEAAAMAAAAGGLSAPAAAQNLVTDRSLTELKWDKAPCRFCGTGCGVMVATKAGRVVATPVLEDASSHQPVGIGIVWGLGRRLVGQSKYARLAIGEAVKAHVTPAR